MSLAPLSNLTTRALSTLIELKSTLGLVKASRTLIDLQSLGQHVEASWIRGGLDSVERDEDIG